MTRADSASKALEFIAHPWAGEAMFQLGDQEAGRLYAALCGRLVRVRDAIDDRDAQLGDAFEHFMNEVS